MNMCKKSEAKKAIRRIKKFEKYYIFLCAKSEQDIEKNRSSREFVTKYKKLVEYYESGLWLSDYERDEKGELPPDLGRGCLSQDGIYNLISSLESGDQKWKK